MFQLLDIAYPGRPYRPRIILEPDTPEVVKIDTVTEPAGTDSIIPQELLDSCKESVVDTIRSAANFFTDFGAGNGHSSSLLMTTLMVVAALTLCAGFVWMYRRNIQKQNLV